MHRRLEGLDLNLLLALHWLLAERNVTAAAGRLGLSQPAASRALGRLRDIFEDPLLVKVGGEMAPTPLAESIQPQLGEAMDRFREILRVSGEFVPENQEGRFRVACVDYIGVLLAGIWGGVVQPQAPKLSLDLLTPTLETAKELVMGKVDVCILPGRAKLSLPPTIDKDAFVQKPIFQETFMSAVRKDHPLAGKDITLDEYVALDHILISPDGEGKGHIDEALAKIGRERNIRFRAQTFLMAVPLARFTDCVVTAPKQLLALRQDDLYVFEPPVEPPQEQMFAVWHPNWTHDARHKWVRELMFEAIANFKGCPFDSPESLSMLRVC